MIEAALDRMGEANLLALVGGMVGVIFGIAAQHSRFCLRAATAEVSKAKFGPRLSVWLVAFATGVLAVQGLVATGVLDVSESRQLATTGSLSGAIIGGLMFGAGMILARGCASRLLVLSATGNLRALVTGLVLTVVAQSTLRGVLAPAREALAGLWLVPGGAARDLLALTGLSAAGAATVALIGLTAALLLARKQDAGATRTVAAAVVGLAVAMGWLATYLVSQASFEVVPISSVTFTGPSADTLMGLINSRDLPVSFALGLVPGVFAGAGLMAAISGELKIERFGPETPMERYLIGAALMGFGSMLAGGCAVGAGMSGGAVMALTAWVAVFFMWVGAVITQKLMTRAAGAAGRATA